MKVVPLLGAALVIYVGIPGSNQGKGEPKFCQGADGNRYKKGESYEDKENCIRYTCAKIQNKLEMKKENIIPCTGDISTIVEISQKTKRTITDTNLNTVINFNVHNGMGSDCYSIYSRINPYPAARGKSLSECQTICTNNPECGAILMLKASIESGGSTTCYMIKPNNLFNEGTCTWGSGTYNAYEKKITVCTADATNEAACFCKSAAGGAGEVCTPEQKCNGDGTCQDGQTDTIDGSLKLDTNGVPYLLIGSKWMPICGHFFWDNNIGADIVCQNLGYSQGGVLQHVRGVYKEDAYYVGRCDSKSITDLENGCTKLAAGSCKKGSPVSIIVKCRGSTVCPADVALTKDCICAGISCATGSTCVGGSTCTAVCPADVAVTKDCMCAGISCATGSTCVGGSTCTAVLIYKVYKAMESSCYSKYTKIYPYPAASSKSLSECKTICSDEPECGAIVMLKSSVESGGTTSCYMIKPNNLFNEGTCTWGNGNYNAYEKKVTVCTADATNEAACFCKSATGGAGEDCTPGQKCNGDGTCQDGHTIDFYSVSSSGEASKLYGDYMGNYYLTGDFYNNFPIFSNGNRYVFVDSNGYWLISNEATGSNGYIHHPLNNPTPTSPPKMGWLYWDGEQWNTDASLTVINHMVCTADATNEAACFCKSAAGGAGEACTPGQKCNGDGTCQDGNTIGHDSCSTCVPLGTIISWVNKPEDNAIVVRLPSGWQPCDGSVIPQPSIWAGLRTPNLNGEKRFLRGGSNADMLKMEEDTTKLPDHTHIDNGHTHKATSSADPHSHTYNDKHIYLKRGDICSGRYWELPLADEQRTTDDADVVVTTTVDESYSNMGGVKNLGNFAKETRPKNMNVIFIMKVL